MIKILNLSKSNNLIFLDKILNDRKDRSKTDTSIVSKILKDIKKNKLKAVLKYEKKFGNNTKVQPNNLEIKKSIQSLNPQIKYAIDLAYTRIEKFHNLQKIKKIKYVDKFRNKIEYKPIPINKLGIYVPANLPSTLLMNAVPAKIAGVRNIVLANPKMNGKLNPAVMYVAKKCGIKNIINIGGAQAIGYMAYVNKVDKIIGPGNDYVARAKKEVFGDVGIEGMIAGPSEVTIIADSKSNIDHLATSMLAQSEHGINSQSILISKNKSVIQNTKKKLSDIINILPRKKIVSQSLSTNGLLILAKNDKQIIDIANKISPEHLEIITENNNKFLEKILNAGSIGIGKYSPVAASDYTVGTNHTLGTLGSARYSSGLNLGDFYKKISIFNLTKKGIEVIGKQAITLAEYENLYAHALSIKSRIWDFF